MPCIGPVGAMAQRSVAEVCRSLGYNPATGVTLVIARRCITIMYAAIGLVLVTTSETVKRAKQARQTSTATAPAPADPSLPIAPLAVADDSK